MIIREMTIDDYEEVYQMWLTTSKRALSKADEKDQMERYLKRNAGMSQVAVIDGKIVGTVLAGHDGRRGFIHHMAVMPQHRRRKIGHSLAEKAIEKIKAEGIDKTHILAIRTTKLVRASGGISALKSETMCSSFPTITINKKGYDKFEYKRKRFEVYNAYLW